MSDLRPSSQPERNPETHRAHRREVLLQITMPLVLILLAYLAVIFFVAQGQADVLSRWGDIAAIWIIIPVIFLSLILLAVVGGLAYSVYKLVEIIPPYARQVQDIFVLVGEKIKQVSDLAAKPVLLAGSVVAGIKAAINNLRRR